MSEPRYLPADAIVRVALWLHDRFCGKTDAAVRIDRLHWCYERHSPIDANYERALSEHLQDGWINAAGELLLLAREVDQ